MHPCRLSQRARKETVTPEAEPLHSPPQTWAPSPSQRCDARLESMPLSPQFYRRWIPVFSNPWGLAIDRLLVRFTDWSLLTTIYRGAGGLPNWPSFLMTTIHWKSGRLRSVVLPYTHDGDRMIIVGSHGGRPTDAIWSLNLRAHPIAWVRIRGKRFACSVRLAAGEEHDRLWSQVSQGGAYAHYAKTAYPREIPIFLLVPLDTTATRPAECSAPEPSHGES